MTTLLQRGRTERGAALLEVALTLPLLLLVCVGILEFGRAYQTWQVITNAAREGARIAVLPGMDDTAVRTRVREYMTIGQLPKANDTAVVIDINRNQSVSVGGTATVALSSGSTLTFAVKGKYNAKTDSTLLILSADAASKGSSLKVNWAGSGAATLQGKLTGQTIKTSAIATPE